MPTPNYSIVFSAQLVGASTVQRGKALIPSEDSPTTYVVATLENRNGRRSEGVALTSYSGSKPGSVQMQQSGTIDADISGLAAGPAAWARVADDGSIERVEGDVADDDDVIGWAGADGRVHLLCGILTADMANASGVTVPGTSGQILTSDGDDGFGTPITPPAGDLVGTTATQTLTGKTINGSNNTITNVSLSTGVTGTLPISNIAMAGSNGQVLMRAGAANAWNYVSNTMVSPTAGIEGTKIAPDFGAQNVVTTGYGTFASVRFGTTPAADGHLRFPYFASATTYIAFRNAGNSGDYNFLSGNGADVTIGSTSYNLITNCAGGQIVATSSYSIYAGGQALYATPGLLGCAQPVGGDQRFSVPFRFKQATITQSSTSDTTLSAAQYECPLLVADGTPGGSFNWILPNTAGAVFWIYNGTVNTLTAKRSGQIGGVAIATGKTAMVIHTGSGYTRGTSDA